MKDPKDLPPEFKDLRRRAEKEIKADAIAPEAMSPAECARLMHELRVQQIELEMQNEELRQAQAQLAESRDKYADLYDFAPVGYLTLDERGRIVEANLTAATMLGMERGRLLGLSFPRFLEEADRPVFRQLLAEILQQQQQQQQFLFKSGNVPGRAMLLDFLGVRDAQGRERLRLAMTDVSELKRVQEELRQHQENLEELVTERTAALSRANEQLRQANEELQALFQAAPLAIGMFDAEGRVVSANPAAERMFGWSVAELQGRQIPSIPAAKPEESWESLQRVLQGETLVGVELEQQRKDGSLFSVSISAAPLRDQAGKVRGFVGLCEDVSEHRRAAGALQTQVRVLASMMEGVLVTDDQGEIIYANAAFDRMFGYEPGELLGRQSTGLNAYPPEENQAIVKKIIGELNSSGSWHGEIHNRKKDGTSFYTAAHLSALQLDGKKLYISVQEDITERMQGAAALVESEERYRSLFQNNHAVMLLIDPENADVVDANPAACAYYGYSLEELQSKKITEINTLPVEKIRSEMKLACLGEQQQFYFQHCLASGAIREVEVFSGPITVQGKKLLYSIVHDITERKLLEAEVAMKAQLLDLSNDSIFVADPEGNFQYVNEAAYKTRGYSREELLHTHLTDLDTPEQAKLIHERSRMLQEKGEASFESAHRRKDGSVMPVEVYAKQIKLGGQVVNLSSVRDISARFQAAEEQQRSNQRLDLLAGTASQLLASAAPRELINDLSQKLSTFLDTEVFLNFLAETETGRLRLNAYAGITGQQAGRIEWIDYGAGVCGHAAKGGRRIEAGDIQNSLNPRTKLLKSFGLQAYACHPLLVEGKVLGTLGFGSRKRRRFTESELTLMQAVADQVAIALERQEAEEALAESERRYRSLFENNHAVMLLTDPETADIVDANPAACSFYGYAKEELTAQKITEINTLPLERIREVMKPAGSGEEQHFFFQHRLADGTVRDVEVFSGPITVKGKKLLYSIVHDITERRQAEEELHRSYQRLDLLAGSAGELLASKAPQQVIDNLCMKLLDFLHGEVYLNYLADVEDKFLILNAYKGIGDEEAERMRWLKFGQGVCGYTALKRRRMVVENIQESSDPQVKVLKGFGLKTYACHPLLAAGRVLGTLGFGSRHRTHFDDDELGLMNNLADQVAMALDRQQALQGLADSEKRYRQLVEMSPDAILVHQRGRYVFINQAGAALFGAEGPKMLLGRRVLETVHPDFVKQVKKRVWQVKPGRPPAVQELKILRLDGTAVDVEASAVPVPYRGEAAVQVMLRDITRRKEAEAALRDREARLASILTTAPVGIGLVQDRVIIEVNQRLGQMIGYAPEELLGRSSRLLYPTQEDFDYVGHEKYDQISQQGIGTVTTRWIRKDGGIIDILLSSAPLEVDNQATGVTFCALDITELKQATEALRQERDFSAALLNTLGALVVVLDREGRIVSFNQACEMSTGYAFPEVVGKYFFDIFLVTKEKASVREVFGRLSAGDFPLNYENHWLARSGEKRLISWSNSALTDADGKVTYIIGTGIDITRQRQAEEALRQAHDELEQRVAARTEQLRQTVDKLLLEIIERERAETNLQKSEARFAAFMRNLPGSAIMRDRAGRFLFANEAWELSLGRRPGESLGKTLDDLWPPKIAAGLKELDRQVLAENRALESIVELPVHGEKRTYLSHRFPIRNLEGEVEMVGAIGIDITERLKAEEARDRLIEILEATPDFVGSADREGRLFYLNRAAREMLGLGLEDDFTSLSYGETMPAWAVDRILSQGRPVYLQEGVWQGESAIRRRDGSEIPVSQVILAHRDSEGQIKFFSTVCRDIREIKRVEEALRKSEEKLRLLTMQLLTAQEDERQRLATELHDELGHALLILKLHLSEVEQKLLPEQAELKEKMAQMVAYLTDTVEEVRRLYYALSPGDLEDLGLTTALRNLVEDFQELYVNINWDIELDNIDRLYPLPIQTMIYRIVQEALTNIGKHAYPENVKIKIIRKEQQAVFHIEDDGRGFSMDDVLEGDKRGMGLAAMAQRVSLAGGTFGVWSRENQGVRILFNIPFSSSGEKI